MVFFKIIGVLSFRECPEVLIVVKTEDGKSIDFELGGIEISRELCHKCASSKFKEPSNEGTPLEENSVPEREKCTGCTFLEEKSILERKEVILKVQLFENSYFNYFTGYLMKPIGQFLIQLERESFCLKTIQDQTRIQDQDSWHFFGEEVKASKALEALILETSFGDFLFNDRLKVKIYEAVESEFKIVNPNFEKILKEETVEIAIFLKIKVDLDQLQSYHFSDFDIAVESLERKNLMFELKAREAKEFYPYNWVYRRVLPPSKVGYDPEASLKYNHEAAKNLSEVQLKRTQHKSKISFRTDTASEN